MAFSLNRTGADHHGKKSPLAGWLGRKGPAKQETVLPEADIAAGLSRALRGVAKLPAEKASAVVAEDDPVRDALATIEAALFVIDQVREILEQACDVVVSAQDAPEAGGRALLAESYDELRLSINKAVREIDPRAANLIGKEARHLDVNLGGKTNYAVSAMRLDVGERGLNLSPPRHAFEEEEEIVSTLSELDWALSRSDRAAAAYCSDAQYLIARMNGELEAQTCS
ncbi:MAG: hypothetical protein AAGA09_05670 [Pseudomonadota bacterium]